MLRLILLINYCVFQLVVTQIMLFIVQFSVIVTYYFYVCNKTANIILLTLVPFNHHHYEIMY